MRPIRYIENEWGKKLYRRERAFRVNLSSQTHTLTTFRIKNSINIYTVKFLSAQNKKQRDSKKKKPLVFFIFPAAISFYIQNGLATKMSTCEIYAAVATRADTFLFYELYLNIPPYCELAGKIRPFIFVLKDGLCRHSVQSSFTLELQWNVIFLYVLPCVHSQPGTRKPV